jgi:hypothetical protein
MQLYVGRSSKGLDLIQILDNSLPIKGGHVSLYRRGRAIAQAVSRWLLTAAARVQNRV